MNVIFKNTIRFVLLVFVQSFVLNKISLHQMITPYVYFIFIFWLPFSINRTLLLILGFALGYTVDSFQHHPGFHASACVLIAYLRPFLLNLLITQDNHELSYEEPSYRSLGGMMPYLVYTGALILIHNSWLFLLEAWQLADVYYFIFKTILSTIISFILLFIIEIGFSRKQKYRTNA